MASSEPGTQARADGAMTLLRPLDIFRFHLPLAVTFLSYGVVFNIINAAMSDTADAAAALAAFAVGQSIVDLFAGPAGVGNQWLISRGRDRRSFMVGIRVMAQIALGVSALLAVFAFTPAGQWLYQDVFGAPARLAPEIARVIKITLLLPLLWAWRNSSQSVLMLRRLTHFMSIGVFLRLGFVAMFSVALRGQSMVEGAAVGAILWVGGMTVEALFLFVVARQAFARLPAEPAAGALPSPAQIWRFLLPLMATGLLWAVSRPLANAAMARTVQSEAAIAAFQVGWFASFLLVALQVEFRQVVVVFWSDRQSLQALQRFGLRLSASLTALALAVGVSGAAGQFMRHVLGTPEDLIPAAVMVFVIAAAGPLLWMITELKVGQLLRNGTTTVIGIAKAVNLVVMASTLVVLVNLAPQLGAVVGVLGYVAGALTEAAVAWWFVRGMDAKPVAA